MTVSPTARRGMLAAVDLPEVTAQPHCPALGSLSCRFGAVSWRREPLNGGHGTWAAGGVHGHPLAGIQGDLRVVTSDAGVLLRPLWGFQHGYNLYKGRRRQQILINSRSARQAPLQTGLPKNIQKNLDVARLAFFPAACNFPAVSPSPSGVLPLPCSRHLPPCHLHASAVLLSRTSAWLLLLAACHPPACPSARSLHPSHQQHADADADLARSLRVVGEGRDGVRRASELLPAAGQP